MRTGTKADLVRKLEGLLEENSVLEETKAKYERLREQFGRSERERGILSRIAAIFCAIGDDEAYGEVLAVIIEALQSRHGFLGYIAQNGDLVVPSLTRDVWEECTVPGKSVIFPPSSWGESIWGKALKEKRSFSAQGPVRTPFGHIPIRNCLLSPVLYGEEAIGLIAVANRDQGYSEEDRGFLEDIAVSISPILHARLQRDREEKRSRLTQEALHRREQELRTLAENLPDMVARFDRECRFLYVNPSVLNVFSEPREHFIGRTIGEALHGVLAGDRPLSDLVEEVFESGASSDCEVVVSSPQGDRFLEARHIPEMDESGKVATVLGIYREVTDRKKAEEDIAGHLKFFESMDMVNRAMQGTDDLEEMIDNLLDVLISVFACDRAWLVYPCDPGAQSWKVFMERTRPEYPGALSLGADIPMTPDMVQTFRIMGASKGPVTFGPQGDHALPAEDSTRFDYKSALAMVLRTIARKPYLFGLHQCSYARVWTPDEERLFRVIGRRLTDSLNTLLAHRNLQESEERQRFALRVGRIGVFEVDIETGRGTWTPESAEIWGVPGEVTDDFADFLWQHVHPDDLKRVREGFDRMVQKRKGGVMEFRIVRPNGTIRWIRWRGQVLKTDTGKLSRLIAVNMDITEHKLADETLETSRVQLSQAMDLAHIVYWECDPARQTFIFNDPFYAFLGTAAKDEGGYVIAMDEYFRRFVHPEDYARVRRTMGQDMITRDLEFPPDLEHRVIRHDGKIRHVATRTRIIRDAAGSPVRIYGANQDITEGKEIEEERRSLETSLFHSQKIESIGTLTGGIAHDFNNILTAVMGYATLLQMKMDEEDPLLTYVDEILSASQKAADLTQSLMAFSRQQPVNSRALGINDIIKGSERLLKRLVTEDIAIKTVLTAAQPVIMADATQMDQVLLNIAANARDAMPQGGVLTIETDVVDLDEKFRRMHGYGKPGKYAVIAISDTGTGMDEVTKERIFDPFFTTKEVGKGTGLGLSTVYGIVKQHRGFITVYSEPGHGTVFRLYFPVLSHIVEQQHATIEPVSGGHEVILIAEDSAPVLTLMSDVLTQYGYTVIEATDGVEAIERFSREPRIDLLILDSIMPRKNGREAYDEIHKKDPGVKVLFTSGYTRDVVLDKGIEDKRFDFLSKPIQPLTLLNRVREILDR